MVNFNDFYHSDETQLKQQQLVVEKLAQSLMDKSDGELEHYQAVTRVKGILNRSTAEVVQDVKGAIYDVLPPSVDGKPVGYVLALMTTEVDTDEYGNPKGALIGVHQGLQMEQLFPVQPGQGKRGDKWIAKTSRSLDLNLAAFLGKAGVFAEKKLVHLLALEYDIRSITAIVGSMVMPGQQLVPRVAYSWAIHDGWLWENENVIEKIGEDTPIVETPSLIHSIDRTRQSHLESLFRVERALSKLQENADYGESRVIHFSSAFDMVIFYGFVKTEGEEDAVLLEPFPGSKGMLLEQMVSVLADPEQEGRIILENRKDGISLQAWDYQKEKGFTPIDPKLLEETLNRQSSRMQFKYEPETTKTYPQPFSLE